MNKYIMLILLLALATLAGALPLTIFYTGDSHGVFESNPSKADPSLYEGGYLILEETLAREREVSGRSLWLDSGDQQTGTIFSSLVADGVHGGAVIEVFNLLGLDASVFGNHEFDFSYKNTLDLARRADYHFVCTNLTDNVTRKPVGGFPYAILERDGLRIGIMGITLELLPEKVKAENVSNISILPPREAIGSYLEEVDAASDLIVVLTHQGFEADSLLAESLDSRVDIIIGGHDHILMEEPYQVNGIYLLYSGSHLNYLGKAVMDVVDDRIASFDTSLIPLTSENRNFSTPLAEYINDQLWEIEADMSRVIASIPEDWNPDKYRETAVSRWLAYSLKAEYEDIYHPDLAIINNGGIRKAIPAGPVTLRDMHEMLPFNNTVVVFSCYGRDIIAYDELNARHALEKPHDICQSTAPGWPQGVYKGDRYPEYDPMPWRKFNLGSKDLDPDTRYRVISHDYIVGQWDKYLGFKPFDVYDTGELLLEAMIRQVQKQYPLPEEEGRD